MTQTPEIKSQNYIIVMDKDRDSILNFMLSASMRDPKFIRTIQKNNLGEALNDFITDTSDKSHVLGWCGDPNCIWEPKEKKNG